MDPFPSMFRRTESAILAQDPLFSMPPEDPKPRRGDPQPPMLPAQMQTPAPDGKAISHEPGQALCKLHPGGLAKAMFALTPVKLPMIRGIRLLPSSGMEVHPIEAPALNKSGQA